MRFEYNPLFHHMPIFLLFLVLEILAFLQILAILAALWTWRYHNRRHWCWWERLYLPTTLRCSPTSDHGIWCHFDGDIAKLWQPTNILLLHFTKIVYCRWLYFKTPQCSIIINHNNDIMVLYLAYNYQCNMTLLKEKSRNCLIIYYLHA